METLEGTLMLGVFAMLSLPIAVMLMIWGLASDASMGDSARASSAENRNARENRVRLPRAA